MKKKLYKKDENYIIKTIERLNNQAKCLCCFSILGAVITAIPWFITILINGVLLREAIRLVSLKTELWMVSIIFVIILVILRIPNIIGFKLNSWASEKLSGYIQMRMIKNIIKANEVIYPNNQTGNVMERILNDCAIELSDFFFQGIGLKVIEPFILGVLACIILLEFNWRFLLVCGVMAIIATIISKMFEKRIKKEQENAQCYQSDLSEMISDILQKWEAINISCTEDDKLCGFESICKEVKFYRNRVNISMQTAEMLRKVVELLAMVLCLGIAFELAERNQFYFPDIIILLQMYTLIENLVSGVGTATNYMTKEEVFFKRVVEILDYKSEEERKSKPDIKPMGNIAIKLKNVSWGYDKNEDVLHNINVTIAKGERVAIIGENGSGKSTLFRIMLGMYSNFNGNMEMFDTDFKECNLRSWRNKICMLNQEDIILNRTIEENICLCNAGSLTLREQEKMHEAAKKAGIYKYIENLPHKYKTEIQELGRDISGGEKQRIAMARIFYRNAPILLLDEPTSALDRESEKIVVDSINNLPDDITVILISHTDYIISHIDIDTMYMMKAGKLEKLRNI